MTMCPSTGWSRSSQLNRDPSRTPLVQALVVLQQELVRPARDRRAARRQSTTCRARPRSSTSPWSSCDRDGSLDITAEYNTDLFDAATVAGLVASLEVLLEGIADDPHRQVASFRR